MKLKILILLSALIFNLGSSSPQTTTQKLPSGKEIKILGMGKMHFTKGTPALALKYQTDISVEKIDLIRQEVEEIWPFFRYNVEQSRLSNALIMATSPPEKSFFGNKTQSQNFVATMKENGTWNLNSWQRNYDNEAKDISEKYLDASKNSDLGKISRLFHYPHSFSSKQLDEEVESISQVITNIIDELGTIDSYKLNNTKIIINGHFTMQSASQGYWRKYPYFNRSIYDVNFSKQGKGNVIFSFSIIEGEMVINSVSYALPNENHDAEMIFNKISKYPIVKSN